VSGAANESAFRRSLARRRDLLDPDRYERVVVAIAGRVAKAFRDGNKVLWCGNGGSAADAQHLAAEFSGRYLRERRGLPSESLAVNPSAVTAIANDYGFDRVFARQVEAFASPGDVVIGLTTSGNSRNVNLALDEAKTRGATAIAFTGNGGGEIARIAEIALIGPTGISALVQEVHITMGHIVCELVETELFDR